MHSLEHSKEFELDPYSSRVAHAYETWTGRRQRGAL